MEDVERFRDLEEGLWKAAQRGDQTWLSEVVSEEFVEYCRFGHVYDRDHLITSEAHDLEVVFPFADFAVERLADDIVLVSYVNTVTYRDETARVRRSSIWIRQDESWLLKFQQATTLPT